MCAFATMNLACCTLCACLPACGHGRGNRAPCAGRSICASLRPLDIYIYVFGSQSCTTRLPLLRSARLAAPTVTAQCILGCWANGACVRLSRRGKARLLPRAASSVRSAILRRRNTASSSRTRPVAHHANRRRAVPLRSLLTHAPSARPSALPRIRGKASEP